MLIKAEPNISKADRTSITTSDMTIYVDADNGSNVTGDGSVSKPYETIQYAWNSVPTNIAHKVILYLKKATASYSKATLSNKFLVDDGEVYIQGETEQLDSGSVDLCEYNQNDKVYGSDVLVATLTDTSKSWTPDEYKYKMVRVYKTGEEDQYRIILDNDSDKLYVQGNWQVSWGDGNWRSDTAIIPDNTWSYEIVEWGAKVDGLDDIALDMYNIQGRLELQTLEIVSSTSTFLIVNFEKVSDGRMLGCYVHASIDTYGVLVKDSNGFLNNCLVVGTMGATNASGIAGVRQYGIGTLLGIGVVIDGYPRGLWVNRIGIHWWRGIRFYNIGSAITSRCVDVGGYSVIGFDGTWGTTFFHSSGLNSVNYGLYVNEPPTSRARVSHSYYYHSSIDVEVFENYFTRTGDSYRLNGPLEFGEDVNLYRESANVLKTDNEFRSAGAKVGDGINQAIISSKGVTSLEGEARVTKDLWIDASGIKAPGSKPATEISFGALETSAWRFSDEGVAANQQAASWRITPPYDMDRTVAPVIRIGWSSASSGSCEWQLEYRWLSQDEDCTAAAEETLTVIDSASITSNGLVVTTLNEIDIPSSTDASIIFRLKRLSAGANDTISDTTELHGVCFNYVINKLGE